MRSAALVLRDEYDEVPVSSNEVLEANVVAIRADITDIRGVIARIDNDIKSAVARLEAEIRAMASRFETEIRSRAEKIESDMKERFARVDAQLDEMRQDMREMRADDKKQRDTADGNYRELCAKIESTHDKLDAKIDRTHRELSAKIDAVHDKLDAKIDQRFDATNQRIDVTNEKLDTLDRKVTDIGSKLTALLWVVGGLGTFITLVIAVGRAIDWFSRAP